MENGMELIGEYEAEKMGREEIFDQRTETHVIECVYLENLQMEATKWAREKKRMC